MQPVRGILIYRMKFNDCRMRHPTVAVDILFRNYSSSPAAEAWGGGAAALPHHPPIPLQTEQLSLFFIRIFDINASLR
jgi:hypothetical protein